MIKSFLLSLLVGLPVLAAVTYFFLYPRYIASQQQATAPAPIISTTAIPSPTQNPAPNCPDNDLTCFIAAVKTCSPTSTEWTSKITLFGTFIQTTKSQLTLETPETAGKCRFVSRVENVSVEFTPQALQQVKTQGLTDSQMQQQLQESNAQAKQTIGLVTSCTFPVDRLSELLTNWSKGNVSSSDLTSEDCTATDASGKPRQLPSANGTLSVSPTPSGQQTVSLYDHSDVTFNGLEFKVGVISSTTKLDLTVTDHATNKSVSVTLLVNQPMAVLSYNLTLTGIKQTQTGTANGKPVLQNVATVSYK